MKLNQAIYRKETSCVPHEVSHGFGKYEGKFIADSRGWGGAEGYFKIFDSEREAIEYVEGQTKSLPSSDMISF